MELPVSVVVISRGRPKALARCLRALHQVVYDPVEIVVVTDTEGLPAAKPYGRTIKTVAYDKANISGARNVGISVAAGEVIAFIDDDAVPEPSWLYHLVEPLKKNPDVAMSGGFVRGRNGISWQWRAEIVDTSGFSVEMPEPSLSFFAPDLPSGHAAKTQGTNMAVRRSALTLVGGFDEAFKFFLDETDLNMRLAVAGRRIAFAPKAEVHHEMMSGPYRRSTRLPKSLHEIGASFAVFLEKHDGDLHSWHRMQAEQRRRLLGHMQRGTCEPRDVGRLMRTLVEGWEEGKTRELDQIRRFPAPPPFRPLMPPGRHGVSKVLAGRIWQLPWLRKQARAETEAGNIASIFVLSPTTLFHRVRYTSDGYWIQRGGLFGRSDRDAPYFRFYTFGDRVSNEVQRVRSQRLIG